MDWLTDEKIPLGRWIESFVDLLLDHGAWFFDYLSEILKFMIEGVTGLALALPALVLVALLAGLAFFLHRSWKLVAAVVLTLLLVINLGYWENTVQTLTLILFSTVICIAAGVPVGIAAAHRPWLYNAIRPVLDLMQTIPTFVYLIP
ncbi:MAG: choline ABC transporter permease subunit, partial [Defluviicoccus sp.]|nr:choline ABC transporter permease subunit [Defluviicoccus sp.]